MTILVDADILIWHLRGRREAIDLLRQLRANGEELVISAAQRIEVMFFRRPGEEETTRALLSQFRTEPVTETVVDQGAALFQRWRPRHGTDEADAILAATAMLLGARIITQNVKHFPRGEIDVERGWLEPGQEDR